MRRLTVQLLIIAALLGGPGLVLRLATIDAPLAGAGQTDRSWLAGYLDDQHQFGQFASLTLSGLTGIRLWLPRPVAPGDGILLVHVRQAGDSADQATAQLPVSALAARGPTIFRFAPIQVDPLLGDRPLPLVLILETRGVDRASAVSVMAGRNRYSNGLLTRDGRPIPRADLAFEPLYDARLLDRVLPITPMARRRPGVFGWPPLYALLAYGLLLLMGWFLGRLVCVARREYQLNRLSPTPPVRAPRTPPPNS